MKYFKSREVQPRFRPLIGPGCWVEIHIIEINVQSCSLVSTGYEVIQRLKDNCSAHSPTPLTIQEKIPGFVDLRCWITNVLLVLRINHELTVSVEFYAAREAVFCQSDFRPDRFYFASVKN